MLCFQTPSQWGAQIFIIVNLDSPGYGIHAAMAMARHRTEKEAAGYEYVTREATRDNAEALGAVFGESTRSVVMVGRDRRR